MNIDVFMEELKLALVKRGVPEENAAKHAQTLRQSFDSEDLGEIEAIVSSYEIDALADSIAAILLRKKKSVLPPESPAQAKSDKSVDAEEGKEVSEVVAVQPQPVAAPPAEANQVDEAEDEVFGADFTPNPSAKGMAVFWCALFATMPVTLAVIVVIFGGFAAIFGGLFTMIAAFVIVMIALIAAGAVCALVGIIYGITQLFSFVAAGIYEIGLGITVAGVVLLLSVLIFNFAIRFLPFVIKKTTVFFKFVMRRLKSAFFALISTLRRECYKL